MRDPMGAVIPLGRTRSSSDDDPEIPDAPLDVPGGLAAHGLRFNASDGVCVATWGPPVFIEMTFDRFADERSELTAEIIVKSTVPGLERQIYQRRLNLLSARSVSEHAKALDAKTRERELNFSELLEPVLMQVISAYREGDPAIALNQVPPRLGSRWAIPQLALLDLPTFAWALPEQAKTWLAVAVACSLQTGRRDILGLEPSGSLNVGFVDYEQTEYDIAERAAMICGGEAPPITYVRAKLALWDELDRLLRIKREHRLNYFVIDSAGMACGGLPPESSEAALRFNTAGRRLGVGHFVTAHTTKDGAENTPFGSVFWLAQMRLGWLTKREDDSENGFTLAAFCKKASTDRRPSPLAWSLSFADSRVRFQRADVRDVPELAGLVPLRGRLQHALATGPRLISDLAAELDAKADTVRRTLERSEGKSFVRVPGAAEGDPQRWANLAEGTGS
jgi:hypothetical protein